MPHMLFSRDFDFVPRYGVTLAYLRGQERLVTTKCALAALAAGAGTVTRSVNNAFWENASQNLSPKESSDG